MASFTVTNLNDSGAGSLRAAITEANAASPGSPNTINFDPSIAGGTITLQSDLPSITNPTSIVASSTTAGSAPTIEINFNGHAGLTFDAGSQGSQLIGVALGGASGAGVTLNAGSILLNNNYIGLALDGTALGNTGDGVFVASTSSGSGATLSGGFLEIRSGGTAGTSQINFTTGGTGGGTLQLDDSVHFNGVISGFGVPGGIDLRDISFANSGFSLGYSGDTSSGILTVTDGTNTAQIHLLGQYVAGNFTAQTDGNGGTLITDPPVVGQYSLYNPHT